MLILTLLAALALVFVVLAMTLGFGMHCQTKFGFKPLAPATICLWQLYAVLFYAGQAWMAGAAQAHGDILNGLIVAGGSGNHDGAGTSLAAFLRSSAVLVMP